MTDDPVEVWESDDGHLAVEAYDDDGEFTHQLSVDDWIAHEHEDVVEAYVEHVGARDGVDDAVHEDREVVLIAAPGLAAATLGREAERWFRERLPSVG